MVNVIIIIFVVANYIVGWLFTPVFIKDCKFGEKQTLNISEKITLLILFLTGAVGFVVVFGTYLIYNIILCIFNIIIIKSC